MPARCDALQWRCNIFAHMSNVKYILHSSVHTAKCTECSGNRIVEIHSKTNFFARSKLWDNTFAQHPHNAGADASICNVFIFLDSSWWYVYLTWWTIIPNTLWIMSKHKLKLKTYMAFWMKKKAHACERTSKWNKLSLFIVRTSNITTR